MMDILRLNREGCKNLFTPFGQFVLRLLQLFLLGGNGLVILGSGRLLGIQLLDFRS